MLCAVRGIVEGKGNMERLTFVDEDGQVLFDNPSGFPEDVGFTIRELAKNEEWEALDNIAQILANCEQRLKRYKDLEEQKKLLKLPAAMGDEIFFIFMDCPKDYKEEYCRDHEGSCENCHHRVPEIVSRDFRLSDIPNMDKIFATREEAEAALKELER